MSIFNANDTLVKPVYDVAFYGQDVVLPIVVANDNLTVIDYSTDVNQLRINGETSPATTSTFQIEEYSRAISDVTELGISNLGNLQSYTRILEYLSDMSAWIYKFDLTFAVNKHVTVEGGNITTDTVSVTIEEYNGAGKLVREIIEVTKPTYIGNGSTAGSQISIMNFSSNKPFKISQGNIVRITINIPLTSTTGTGCVVGIMPYYYLQTTNVMRTLYESALILHIHPALDHAYPVLRDASITTEIDYDGVDETGVHR